MTSHEPDSETREVDDEGMSLSDTIFLDMLIPQILAGRIVRGHVVHAILTALLREGIMSRDDLSAALANAEQDVRRVGDKMLVNQNESKAATETAKAMKKEAARITETMRNKFILGVTP
jgi:hypothetical protein